MGFYERIDARGVRETGRPVSFVPKGALTHHPRSGRWYCLRQPCALRGGCGSCGSLMSNATSRLCCCHWPRCWWPVLPPLQNTVASTDGIPPTARTNLPLAALSAVMTISISDSHFLFEKRNRNFAKGR